MNIPCMSCGQSTSEPPPLGCLHERNHLCICETPEATEVGQTHTCTKCGFINEVRDMFDPNSRLPEITRERMRKRYPDGLLGWSRTHEKGTTA
jgi:hypothetical protein